LVVGLLGVLLAGASIIPDPCLNGDDCCATRALADDCGAVCCIGFQASPENPIVLVRPSGSIPAVVPSVSEPEPVVFEPLIRPPIPA
jgi:hypothetical protein